MVLHSLLKGIDLVESGEVEKVDTSTDLSLVHFRPQSPFFFKLTPQLLDHHQPVLGLNSTDSLLMQ